MYCRSQALGTHQRKYQLTATALPGHLCAQAVLVFKTNFLSLEIFHFGSFVSALDKPLQLDFKNESKVLVLYTGGTIGMCTLTIWRKIKSFFQSGMVRNSEGVLVPQPNAMESRIREIVTMHDEDYSRVGKRFNCTFPQE